MSEPIPVRPEHGAVVTDDDRDPDQCDATEYELPESEWAVDE
ncbi:hypothetical protein AB0G15_05590 [Streptosporangium sp. NPDC023825]